jgi:hypothetical protein
VRLRDPGDDSLTLAVTGYQFPGATGPAVVGTAIAALTLSPLSPSLSPSTDARPARPRLLGTRSPRDFQHASCGPRGRS